MENESQNHETVLGKKLRKQLAVAVRSIQWSYAIFWSLSTREEGVLEWHEGYYNGDIKTRKTVPTMEPKADKIGLLRSEQLRELYKSLLEDDSDQQAKKSQSSISSQSPASLSPEDLTDAEWYYLVCMSFVFKPGKGLPGRALADAKTMWLCNAEFADCKVFSRSLLAKSASIQTVVCFPYLGGVIEIGVTDLVPEDLNLLQHIKASLLDFSKLVCTDNLHPTRNDHDGDDEDKMPAKIDCDMIGTFELENLCSSPKEKAYGLNGNYEKHNVDSLDECSNGCRHYHQAEDSFTLEDFEGGASQVQSWDFMDDDLSIGVKHSIDACDCISEAFADKRNSHLCSPMHNKNLNQAHLRELQQSNDTKLSSLDIGADDDLHYKRTIAAVLGGSPKFMELLCSCECDHESSFVAWEKRRVRDYRPISQQKMLKKILITVPLMYDGSSLEPANKETVEDCRGNAKLGKLRENENFLVIRSIVPAIPKTDKETVLNDTIKYLKELEARVEELESCTDSIKYKARTAKKNMDIVEQTSENCERKKISCAKTTWMNKRKACDIDENDPDSNIVGHKDGLSLDLKVRIKDQEVLIDMKCPYKEYLLLDIMDAINHLHMDSHSVQSSTLDGVFTLSLKSKFRGTAIAPVGMIKQALWKVAGTKC